MAAVAAKQVNFTWPAHFRDEKQSLAVCVCVKLLLGQSYVEELHSRWPINLIDSIHSIAPPTCCSCCYCYCCCCCCCSSDGQVSSPLIVSWPPLLPRKTDGRLAWSSRFITRLMLQQRCVHLNYLNQPNTTDGLLGPAQIESEPLQYVLEGAHLLPARQPGSRPGKLLAHERASPIAHK